ncbi:hypothetical protein L195_g064055, partial [Trifolium pratense]
VSVVI